MVSSPKLYLPASYSVARRGRGHSVYPIKVWALDLGEQSKPDIYLSRTPGLTSPGGSWFAFGCFRASTIQLRGWLYSPHIGLGFKTLYSVVSGAMEDESAVAAQVSQVHEALHDVQSDIGDMEDGVEELQNAWESVAVARQSIAEFAKSTDGVDADEVLTP